MSFDVGGSMESDGGPLGHSLKHSLRIVVLVAFAVMQLMMPAVGSGSGGGVGDGCGCCDVVEQGCGGCCGQGSDEEPGQDQPCDDGEDCLCGSAPAPYVAHVVPSVDALDEGLDWGTSEGVVDFLESEVWPSVVGASAPRLGGRVPPEPGRVDLEFTQVYRL